MLLCAFHLKLIPIKWVTSTMKSTRRDTWSDFLKLIPRYRCGSLGIHVPVKMNGAL